MERKQTDEKIRNKASQDVGVGEGGVMAGWKTEGEQNRPDPKCRCVGEEERRACQVLVSTT